MDNTEHNLTHDAKRVHLLPKEKAAVLARIVGAQAPRPTPSPYGFWFKLAAAPLVLVLVLGGPLGLAAQASGPGDFLYAFEIRVIEPIEESLYRTPESKTAFRIERLKERLKEVREATAEGALDESLQDTVVRNVEEHAQSLASSLSGEAEPEVKIKRLVQAKALVEAHEEVLAEADMATSSNVIDQEIEETSDDYAKDSTEAAVAVAEALEDIREAATTTPPAIVGQIEDIAEAVEDGDLGEALYLASETQANLLKDRYLSGEDVQEEE